MLLSINLLGVRVSRVSVTSACEHIALWVQERARVYVCVAPAATLVEAKHNPSYRDVVNQAAMVTPDGIPVVWLAKAKGCKDIDRTYGPDVMRTLCQKQGVRHYFFGASSSVLEALAAKLKAANPNISIAGMMAPPYRTVAVLENRDVLDQINASKPDIIWVGLGAAKQDFWMAMHRELLDAPVLIGVGAAFDFLAGVKPQAPAWMQKCGLEWLFRLCCEPCRLWKRYLVGNTLYIFYALKELITKT